jgi:V/A-type H+-transporting ATPase subunit A
MNSYSLYTDPANKYYDQYINEHMSEVIGEALKLLQEENRLQEIVRLVGFDSISDADKLKLETAKSIREDYLQQNAFNFVDAHSSLQKQFGILNMIVDFYNISMDAIKQGILKFSEYYKKTAPVRERIARIKFVPEEELHTNIFAIRNMFNILGGDGNAQII